MISIAHFFDDRPRPVAWAVVVLALDAVWMPLMNIFQHYGDFIWLPSIGLILPPRIFEPFFHHGAIVLLMIISLLLPLYLIEKIADGRPTARIHYLIYCGVLAVLFLFICMFSRFVPLVTGGTLLISWVINSGGPTAVERMQFLGMVWGLLLMVSPKLIAYAMLYSPTSKAWFNEGG